MFGVDSVARQRLSESVVIEMSKSAKSQDQARPFTLVVLDDGHVALQFEKPTKDLVFTPEQAKSLGVGFIEMGTRAEYVKRFGSEIHRSAMPARKM